MTYITHTFTPPSYAHIYYTHSLPPSAGVQEPCESRGGRPGHPVPNKPYGFCGCKATLNIRVQELCESRGGRPGHPVPNKPYGFCGCKATLNIRVQELCESRGGRPGLPDLMNLMVYVDVTQHWTMSTRHPRTLSSTSSSSPSDWCKKCKKSESISYSSMPWSVLAPPSTSLYSC